MLRGKGRLVVVGDLRPGGGAGVTAGREERRGEEWSVAGGGKWRKGDEGVTPGSIHP